MALAELGAKPAEVRVEVLDQASSGFLGLFGQRPARVRVERLVPKHADLRELTQELLASMEIPAEVELRTADRGVEIGIRPVHGRPVDRSPRADTRRAATRFGSPRGARSSAPSRACGRCRRIPAAPRDATRRQSPGAGGKGQGHGSRDQPRAVARHRSARRPPSGCGDRRGADLHRRPRAASQHRHRAGESFRADRRPPLQSPPIEGHRAGITADTIVAPATAAGAAALAVVRLAGASALAIAAEMFRGADLAGAESHRAHHGWVVDRDGARIDEVLVLTLRAPAGYTGEDIGGILLSRQSTSRRRHDRGSARRRSPLGGTGRVHAARVPQRQARSLPGGSRRGFDRGAIACRAPRGGRAAAWGAEPAIAASAPRAPRLLADVEASIDFVEEGLRVLRSRSDREDRDGDSHRGRSVARHRRRWRDVAFRRSRQPRRRAECGQEQPFQPIGGIAPLDRHRISGHDAGCCARNPAAERRRVRRRGYRRLASQRGPGRATRSRAQPREPCGRRRRHPRVGRQPSADRTGDRIHSHADGGGRRHRAQQVDLLSRAEANEMLQNPTAVQAYVAHRREARRNSPASPPRLRPAKGSKPCASRCCSRLGCGG